MNNLELIHDFVDGSTSAEQEEILFGILGNNPDARNELKQMMAIKSAVKSDAKAFTPSAESTIKIFSALGFQAPVPVPVAPKAGIASKIVKFAGKYSNVLIGSAVSASLTAAVLLLFLNPNNTEIKKYAEKIASGNSAKTAVVISGNAANQVSEIVKQNDNNSEKNNERIVYKYIVVEKSSNIEPNSMSNAAYNNNPDLLADKNTVDNNINSIDDLSVQNQENIRANEKENSSLLYNNTNSEKLLTDNTTLDNKTNSEKTSSENNKPELIANNNLPVIDKNIIDNNQLPEKPENILNSSKDELLGFEVEFTGDQYWTKKNEIVGKPQDQSINNASITVLYPINDELAVGANYSRENFYQEYNGVEVKYLSEKNRYEDVYFQYYQQPSFSTISAAMRYLPNYFNWEKVNIFSQISLGANSVGWVGRTMIGSQINIGNRYGFVVGYDYSLLGYQHQNKAFYSTKSGIHVGAKIKF